MLQAQSAVGDGARRPLCGDEVSQEQLRMSNFVIGLKHYDGVNAVWRKFWIVRNTQHRTNL
jgi:hypothetical protein